MSWDKSITFDAVTGSIIPCSSKSLAKARIASANATGTRIVLVLPFLQVGLPPAPGLAPPLGRTKSSFLKL